MSCSPRRLILFARYPEAGRVKTRLIQTIGAEGAAALHRRLVVRTVRVATQACQTGEWDFEVRFDGGDEHSMRAWLGLTGTCRAQSPGDLGDRMSDAIAESFREGTSSTVLIGSDCPRLTPELLAAAFQALQDKPAVFGPAKDGGYYLVGLRQNIPELFAEIAWGQDTVLAESLEVLRRANIPFGLLETLPDLDRPEDLPDWRGLVEVEEANLGKLSIIIPALNEANNIQAALAAAGQGNPHEVIVVDGGSTDATKESAIRAGATALSSPPGRARQMNTGAVRATGNVLLFLHADTLLPANYAQTITNILQQPSAVAGAFRFGIAEDFRGKWLVELAANLRSRRLQLPYGDQGLFLRRALFEELGGFADLPILEDYEFVTRLRRRGRILIAPAPVLTSGRRWRTLGVTRTTLTNQFMLAGYHLGLRPQTLARLYRRKHSP